MAVAIEDGVERFAVSADWCPRGSGEIYVVIQFKTTAFMSWALGLQFVVDG